MWIEQDFIYINYHMFVWVKVGCGFDCEYIYLITCNVKAF